VSSKSASAVVSALAHHSSPPSTTPGSVSPRYAVVAAPEATCGARAGDARLLTELRGALPFSCLRDDELIALSRSMEHRHYLPQRPILLCGQSADGLYIVAAGQVKVLIEDAPGRELMLDMLVPGDIFGEVALLDGQPHSSTFEAHTACEVVFIPAAAFWEHVSQNIDALHTMLGVMARRRRYADLTIQRLAFMDVYGRVVTTLVEALSEDHENWVAGPGCQQIAASVGATREMVNRVIRDMVARGAVKRCGRKLLVNRTVLCELRAR
jgi:CRP/FNR family cyclic AMP-dependent transcriptional regulator